jgi:hypothetical protein
MHRALSPILSILLSALPASALAAGPGEMILTAGPGLAVVHQSETRAGAAAEARFLYGLTDTWSAHIGLQACWLPAAAGRSAATLVTPALGLTAAADVLTLVPFLETAILLGDLRGGGLASRQRLGGRIGGGIDYLLTRHLTLTLLGRLDYFALALAGPDGSRPLAASFALHLGHVF